MESDHALSTHDLRSAAVEYKRDKDHAEKWALGEHPLGSGGHAAPDEGRPRPAHRPHKNPNPETRRKNVQFVNKIANLGHISRKHDINADLSSTDASDPSDEEAGDGAVGVAPDAEITYSYDAKRGPGRGSQILGLAVAKAVERFETKETDKLVKDEYEVVDEDESAAFDASPAKKTVEDDFELI